jgi:hypothetical protein
MTGTRRNLGLAACLLGLLAMGAALLPSVGWMCGLAALLGLAGVVVLRGNRWRSGALLLSALAISIGLLNALAGWLAPDAHGAGLMATMEPSEWTVADPDLGYRPRPGIKIVNTSRFGSDTIFRVTYTINGDSTRATPPAPSGADTYLFLGDSFMFGHGLDDDETLPAAFARANDFKVHTVNFSAPGYGPNQLVRALEIGRLDHLAGQRIKAVVTWIIPDHLRRVTGDGPWLGSSPRYTLDDGTPRYTGSFDSYRWSDPLAGLRHVVDQQFAFVRAIGLRQRQERQAEIFTALMLRLQTLAREKFGAPLVVIYSWPDESSGPHHDNSDVAQPMLVSTLAGLRQHGMPMISVDGLEAGHDQSRLLIPHDGHPTALADRLIAAELKRRLAGL